MKEKIAELLTFLGEDIHREGLRGTPTRALKALQYLTHGYQQNIKQLINGAIFSSDNDGMIIIKDIELYSLCEHHMLPFYGKCHIGYLPNGKVFGLSKLARIADAFARRLQIQENLTRQIATCVMEHANAHGVGVIIEARHLCMMMRGVGKQNAVMTTSSMLGNFLTDAGSRGEFLKLVEKK
jgi:GTP cyclohydrolase I